MSARGLDIILITERCSRTQANSASPGRHRAGKNFRLRLETASREIALMFSARSVFVSAGDQGYFFNDRTYATRALISSSESLSLKGFILSLPPSATPSLIN